MKKTFLLYIALVISITAIAQDYNPIYCFNKQQNTVNLDFKKIDNYYERLHLLYSIGNDDRFLVSPSEENGLFYITSNDNYLNDSLLEETFVAFFNEKTEDFNSFGKSEIAEKEAVWKNGIPNLDMLSLMMDYMMENLPRSENDSCHKALPFCTDVGLYQFPAGVNAGVGESGPNYNCLSSRPNPAWYYMRIKDPGNLIITMHSEPSEDIDYCCWGPFDDPITPCPFGLGSTPGTMCSYSADDIEELTISHAQTGQYYILIITNYSNHPCNIIFSKTGGTATTDDSILPPVIEASNQCYGGTLQLSAQDVNNATYSWTGPNGFTSNVREPSIPNVTFAYSGTYTCVMTIPGHGTSDPISIDVEILPSLDANFTVEDPCSGGITKFTGTETTIPPGHNDQISTYLWNFGDGNPDVTEQNPTYRYAEPGVYTVTYTVTAKNDTDGTCESTITKDILIGFGGNVDYTDTICEGEDYNKHGFHFSNPHPGIIYDTIVKPAGYGCDSTICLKLIVGNIYDISLSDTICYGEPYKNHGFYLDSLEAGDTVINVQSATNYGCDSIVTLNLHVASTYNFEVTDTICFGESYKDHGFDIKKPDVGFNTYTNTFGTTLHCDSTWTLNLYVEPSYNLEFEGHICEGEDFHDFGFDTVNPPIGTHVIQKELKTLAGCDSIRILTLTVSEVYDTIIRDSICLGEDYNENGFDIKQPPLGMTYDTLFLHSMMKCDSTVRLELLVNPVYDIKLYDTICLGEEYHGYNFDTIPTETGTFKMNKMLLTTSGCDSIVTMKLTVNETFSINLSDTICFGNSYTEHGFNIENPEVGMTYDTLFNKTTSGCDSISTIELYVVPVYDTTFFDTVCFGNGYHKHGFSHDSLNLEVGINYDTLFLSTVCDCDSTVKLELYVAPVYDTTFIDTICFGNEYHEHGFDLNQLGVGTTYDTLFLHSLFDCDSTVMLELYVAPTYDTTFYDTICFGNSYHVHGFEIENPEVGMTYDTLFNKTTSGCDSISTIELYVAPVYDTTFYDTICRGENYTHHGFKLDSLDTGWHFDTLFLSTICDCDSTVMLELYVAPTYDTTFIDTICFGNEYHNHGFDMNKLEVGTTYDTLFLHSLLGCDSTVMLELYVAPVYDTTFYDTISIGEDYHGHGFDTIAPPAGLCLMRHDYLTELGCDSILTMHLIVGDVYNIELTDTICYGESYTKYGFKLDSLEVGRHHDTLFLKSILGCDSVVSLELDVVPSYLIAFTDTTCFNESYHGHGFDIDSHDLEVGMNYDTLFLLTTLGCDSIITLELYVAPLFNTDLYDTICHGEEYHQHGFDIIGATDGWNFDTLNLHSIIGCDSTVIMHLFVGKIYNPSFTDTICYGQVYTQHGFYLDSLELGFHYDTLYLQSILGCDSIATLELYVAPIYDTTFSDTICFGESYYEHGFNIENPGTGWNYATMGLSTALGCDSVVRLELYVAPTYDINLSDTICFGEDYHGFNFDTINPAAGMCVMQQELTTPIGCDSIVTMNLLVGEVYDINFTDTICFGYDYHEHGFDFTNPDVGFHHDSLHLQSILGCDSTVMLELYVAPVYDTTFFDTICFGESYYGHGFEIENPETGWNYATMELSTTLGCDSIVRLELYVAPTYDINLSDTICFGEDYHGFNFDTINPAVGLCLMQQELATLIGCDSIVTMNLLVGEVYDVNINDTICYGEDYHEYGFNIEAPEVGLHHDTLHLQTVLGCDSTVMLELNVAPTYLFDYSDTICFGESYYEHGFSIENPEQGLGTHWLNFTTVSGCDSVLRLELYVAPVYNINLYDTICHGEDYHNHGFDFILPEPGLHYEYKNLLTAIGCDSIVVMNLLVGDVYDITIKDTICFGDDYHEYNFHFEAPSAGIHTDVQSLSSMHGCDSVVKLRLFVAPTYHTDVIDSICEGENYTKYGLNLIEPEPGIYDLTSSLETQYGCDSVFDVNLKVINKFVAPELIHGMSEVAVSTDMITGIYHYSIDSIEGCKNYGWAISDVPWIVTQDENECTILVTTAGTGTLTVKVGNSCGEVTQSLEINASYFGINGNEPTRINIYPNPTKGIVNVEGRNIEVVNVINSNGLVSKTFKFGKEDSVSLDISDLPSSLYVLEIVTSDCKFTSRIAKTGY